MNTHRLIPRLTLARRRTLLLGALVFLISFLVGLCVALVLQSVW